MFLRIQTKYTILGIILLNESEIGGVLPSEYEWQWVVAKVRYNHRYMLTNLKNCTFQNKITILNVL